MVTEKLLIYQPNVIDTYLFYIKENLILIKHIYDEESKVFESYDPDKKEKFYSSRSKHIQIMSLMGLTTEHLIKIILLKRGFVLNTSEIDAKFKEEFMHKLNNKSGKQLSQGEIDLIYENSQEGVNISFKKTLKSFDKCLSLFNKSNSEDYYKNLGTYVLNPNPEIYNGADYLGFKEIKPNETLKVIQMMRNSYLHSAEAKKEQQGVIWYLFNFLVWLSKKEYPDFFGDLVYIGSDNNKRLFQND